jgi:aminopeptidase N
VRTLSDRDKLNFMAKNVTRLFNQFQPETYSLSLDLDKEALTFKGNVKIKGKKTGRPSLRLTFHQKDLAIKNASIVKLGKKTSEIEVTRINKQASYDEVRLHAKEMIYPGEYEVSLDFSGKITPAMHGIYPCFFKDKGIEKRLIATQFESHHAREAFPCIDEPEAKATFDLTLITELGVKVIANTPLKNESEEDKRLHSTFKTSPRMSTYLLAFAYGEIQGVSAKTKSGVQVTSYATVAQPLEYLNYANAEAVKILEFFEDYFKTPFPLKKLDQIALPDFDSLAMENWGLITYREVGLLSDPKNRSLSGEQLITLVVAHEISHQWFGNLVTMKWWDDLWLNESFASIMENIAPDRLHPDWQQWEDFVTSRVLGSSHRDIYKDVQPVAVKVSQPDEIMTLFDPAIVYAKGARLLSMLFEYIGEEDFRKGLTKYFKDNAYSNTTRKDLWGALGEASNQDVDKLMTPWLEQSGQPLLRVSKDGDKLNLSQRRFLMDGEDDKSLWPIPLLADTELSIDVLKKRSQTLIHKGAVPLFNVNGNGHYIVGYEDDDAKQKLRSMIIERQVSSISRINILNDMFLLARSGEYKLSDMLGIVASCTEEPREAVWSMFSRIIGQGLVLTDADLETEKHSRAYRAAISRYWYEKLGWQDKKDDDPNTKHLRTTALALSISGENKQAIDTALKMYEKAKNVEGLPAEQRGMVAGVAVRFGKPEYIDQLMNEYENSNNPDVLQSITAALCSSRDSKVAKKVIKWGLEDGGVVRQQDIDHWFAYLMRNHYSRDLAWDWFVSSWKRLSKLFSGGKHMEYFVWYSAGALSTRDWQKKFTVFFKPMLNQAGLKRNINIAFSEIEARVQWREREEKSLQDFFEDY